MKKLIAMALMSLPLAALAENSNPDHGFFQDAAHAGMAEVEEGKLAQAQGSSPAIKDFGAMMVKDHSAANAKLKKIAADKNVKLPTEPSLMQKAMKKKLEMKSGAEFDKQYVQDQIKAHEDTARLLRKQINTGKDPEAQAFASETLPTVEAHLRKINELADQMGVKK